MITLKNAAAKLQLLPYRGANTCLWSIDGQDVFYVDRGSLHQPTIKFGGGNPVMFPIFSTLGLHGQSSLRYDGHLIELPQHGFGRTSTHWRPNLTQENQVVLYLNANDETKAVFPFDFQIKMTYTLMARGLQLEQEVFNPSPTVLPFAIGFHPYFAVSDPKNCEFTGHLPGRPCYRISNHGSDDLKAHLPHRLPFGQRDVNHHFTERLQRVTLLDRLRGRRITMETSENYKAMTVWSEPDQPFVCVEPVSACRGAFETREHLIRLQPQQSWKGSVQIEVH